MDVKVTLFYEEGFSVIIKDVASVQDAEDIAVGAVNEHADVDLSDVFDNRGKFLLDGRDPWKDTVHRDIATVSSEEHKP